MTFSIRVKSKRTGNTWWETFERGLGEGRPRIRGYEDSPVFTGDIIKYGQELITWYNRGEPDPHFHREFLEARLGAVENTTSS